MLEKLLLAKNEELGPLPESELLNKTPRSAKKANVSYINVSVCGVESEFGRNHESFLHFLFLRFLAYPNM